MVEKQFDLKVAVLIDLDFFLKRYKAIFKYPTLDPEKTAKSLFYMACKHVGNDYLYRIFCYDSLPYENRAFNPVSKRSIDFKRSDTFVFRTQLHECLKKQRKVALRMGYLKKASPDFNWNLKKHKLESLLKGEIQVKDLTESDVSFDLKQKGVDIKIGLDIATLAYKRLVDKIILVSGDGDFVPAAKTAHTEGIDFVLDPMWNHISDSLFEHIDGLKSVFPKLTTPASRDAVKDTFKGSSQIADYKEAPKVADPTIQ